MRGRGVDDDEQDLRGHLWSVADCIGGRPCAVRTHAHTSAHRARWNDAGFPRFQRAASGSAFADIPFVIWFLEKKDDLLVCEIRRAAGTPGYEFEIADARGPRTIRCPTPKDLIAKYLAEHSRLMREGWRPRAGNVAALE